jgi:hypothetical protein
MNDKPAEPASVHPSSPALALREACRKARCDEGGKRCFACRLILLCESDARWLVALPDLLPPQPAGPRPRKSTD